MVSASAASTLHRLRQAPLGIGGGRNAVRSFGYVVLVGNRPHPLFGFVFGVVVLGVVVGATADRREPVWALHSEWVYRIELGAAAVGVLYLLLVALSLAWQGETFRKITAPGGAGVELHAQKIRSAAAELERYEREAEKRFADVEAELVEVRARVDRLELAERGGPLP
jgi:hypothetical protein